MRLKHGNFSLALMTFLSENVINFRADVVAKHAEMTQKLPELSGAPRSRDPGNGPGVAG